MSYDICQRPLPLSTTVLLLLVSSNATNSSFLSIVQPLTTVGTLYPNLDSEAGIGFRTEGLGVRLYHQVCLPGVPSFFKPDSRVSLFVFYHTQRFQCFCAASPTLCAGSKTSARAMIERHIGAPTPTASRHRASRVSTCFSSIVGLLWRTTFA